MISDSDRTERLYVMLPPEVLKAIDDFRFANRIQNRAAAVRELLRRGLGITGSSDARFAPQLSGRWRRLHTKRK
jgi:hypothetical protein